MNPILVISVCKEKLHELEFVKPVVDLLKVNNINFKIVRYRSLRKKDLDLADKVIICGTSLADNLFIKDIGKFIWLKNYNKPILGICAGMQIIGLVFRGKIKKKKEIGFYNEEFTSEFLGLLGKQEVYHLHGNYIDFSILNEFKVYSGGNLSQAVKHRKKEIYGVLFHPEVRQKKMIINFCEI